MHTGATLTRDNAQIVLLLLQMPRRMLMSAIYAREVPQALLEQLADRRTPAPAASPLSEQAVEHS
jgi:hypothetical protein